MLRALKGFFAFICLVLSIQAVVRASAVVGDVKGASFIKLPLNVSSPAATLNGPVGVASQASAVSANLRKKEENEVDLKGIVIHQIDTMIYGMKYTVYLCNVSIRYVHSITI
jgi:uncharacterized protein YdeI (BOF family)